MKTIPFLFSLTILISSSTLLATIKPLNQSDIDTPIQIIDQTVNSITLSIKSSNISLDNIVINSKNYKRVRMKEWGQLIETGKPYLPYKGIKLVTDENPNFSFEIISEDFEVINNVLAYPAEEPSFAAVGIDQGDLFRKDEKTYKKDEYYPESPITHKETQDHYSIPISLLGIVPVLHNPVKRQLKIYKKLIVKVNFNPINNSVRLKKKAIKTLKNSVVNPEAVSNTARSFTSSDYSDDLIIITTTKFKLAADTLAVWQRKKGYDVKIVAKSSWTTGSVDTEVKNFYNNAEVKPGYLLIIGDQADVPGKSIKIPLSGYSGNFISDQYYTCMGTDSDYVAELARGRISVQTVNEAMTVVKKIIKYETNPPTDARFYQNALACGYFQDKNFDGAADRRFAQTAEEILNYLSPFDINSTRIYFTEIYTQPKRWNNTQFSWGEPVPDHLKKPTFLWDGNKDDIAKGINDGVFLVYHYDHGSESGWGDPKFSINHAKTLLSNNDLLPIIYSIDCLVGKFNYKDDCFAEVITKLENGGAVGIVAATTLSLSGNNEAFLDGMIDATWPGLVLETPNMGKNPVVIEHDPIYTMGDIMNQGLIRMAETWSNYNRYHNEMYHYFGDPTTPLWTKKPADITVTCDDTISSNSDIFKLTNLNIEDGIATIYDLTNDTIVGKTEIDSSGSITIPITYKTFIEGDKLQLTIVSHNYIPKITEITVTGEKQVPINCTIEKKQTSFHVKGSKLHINIPEGTSAQFTLYNLKGKKVYKEIVSKNTSKYSIDFINLGISSGYYIVKGRIGNLQFERCLNILK